MQVCACVKYLCMSHKNFGKAGTATFLVNYVACKNTKKWFFNTMWQKPKLSAVIGGRCTYLSGFNGNK